MEYPKEYPVGRISHSDTATGLNYTYTEFPYLSKDTQVFFSNHCPEKAADSQNTKVTVYTMESSLPLLLSGLPLLCCYV